MATKLVSVWELTDEQFSSEAVQQQIEEASQRGESLQFLRVKLPQDAN